MKFPPIKLKPEEALPSDPNGEVKASSQNGEAQALDPKGDIPVVFRQEIFRLRTLLDAKNLLAKTAFWVAENRILPQQAAAIDRLVAGQVRILKILDKKKEAQKASSESVFEEPLKLTEEDRKIAEACGVTDDRIVASRPVRRSFLDRDYWRKKRLAEANKAEGQ
jgi:hypothetical protein